MNKNLYLVIALSTLIVACSDIHKPTPSEQAEQQLFQQEKRQKDSVDYAQQKAKIEYENSPGYQELLRKQQESKQKEDSIRATQSYNSSESYDELDQEIEDLKKQVKELEEEKDNQ